jgi:hypothetical protein
MRSILYYTPILVLFRKPAACIMMLEVECDPQVPKVRRPDTDYTVLMTEHGPR